MYSLFFPAKEDDDRLVFSLFAIDFDDHLFARSVHTEEGVSSSTRLLHLSLFNSMMMISHVCILSSFSLRDAKRIKSSWSPPQKKKRITNSHQLLLSSNGHPGFGTNKEKCTMMTTTSSLFGVLSSTSSSSSLLKKMKENKTNVMSVRRRHHQRPQHHHHHHASETKRDGRRAGAALSVAAVMMPSLLPSSHQRQHQSSSSSSSSVVSLDNNNNTMKRGKVAAKAAAAARDYHRQQQQSEEDTTISSVNSTTTRTIQERVLNENNASQKRRNKLLGLFGKGSMMFVLVAMMVTASALLFPETALAKSKAVIAEQSSGFSVKVILDWILHLDKHLVELFATSGKMAYGVLFGIIFAETGFVVTPFLPGDSLLFACGALGAIGVLNFPLVYGLLFLAAVLGDTVNYMCGSFFGEVAIRKNPRIFKPDYIAKTRTFYDKYGGRTVVLARFFVIVRTFAPFIAGVAKMNYSKFALYNVMGAGVWITSFMGLGYFFGNVPVVKENFATTIVVIILLSLLPIIVEIVNHKKDSSANSASA